MATEIMPTTSLHQALVALKYDNRVIKDGSYKSLIKILEAEIKAAKQALLAQELRNKESITTTAPRAVTSALSTTTGKVAMGGVELGSLASSVSTASSLAMHGSMGASTAMTTIGIGVSTATTLTPVTMALSPIISGIQVALMVDTVMQLWDLTNDSRAGSDLYRCTCGNCQKRLKFIIDRQEGKAIRLALAATVVLAIPVALYTIGRKTKHKAQGTESEKHQTAQGMWDAARTDGAVLKKKDRSGETKTTFLVTSAGCPKAIATIAVLFGEHSTGSNYMQTLAAISSSNGVSNIKDQIP